MASLKLQTERKWEKREREREMVEFKKWIEFSEWVKESLERWRDKVLFWCLKVVGWVKDLTCYKRDESFLTFAICCEITGECMQLKVSAPAEFLNEPIIGELLIHCYCMYTVCKDFSLFTKCLVCWKMLYNLMFYTCKWFPTVYPISQQAVPIQKSSL